MLDHFFPLLFPKNFKSLKIFDIRLQEVGAKRPINGTSKVNRPTDPQTNRQTDGHFDLQNASAQRADALKRASDNLDSGLTPPPHFERCPNMSRFFFWIHFLSQVILSLLQRSSKKLTLDGRELYKKLNMMMSTLMPFQRYKESASGTTVQKRKTPPPISEQNTCLQSAQFFYFDWTMYFTDHAQKSQFNFNFRYLFSLNKLSGYIVECLL